MKKVLFVLSFLLLLSPVYCQPEESFKITHGPWLTGMNQTGVTIMWTTTTAAVSWVELAPDDGTNFYACERPRYFDTKNGRKNATTNIHSVELTDLQPGTKYRYAIFSKEVLSWNNDSRIIYGPTVANPDYAGNTLTFKTFNDNAGTVNFLIFNDVHGHSQMMKDLCKDVDFSSIDMVIFNGDMTSGIYSEEQLCSDFLDAAVSSFASKVPIVYVRGNHETRGPFADYLSEYFPSENNCFYRFFKIGSAAFLMLDCGEDKPDSDIEYSGLADFDAYRLKEAAWLKKTVSTSEFKDAQIRLAFLHIPFLMDDWHGTLHLDKLFLPVLNDAGITTMFCGHTHEYSYNKPVEGKISFPVLVNGNQSMVKCSVENGRVKAMVINADGSAGQVLEF